MVMTNGRSVSSVSSVSVKERNKVTHVTRKPAFRKLEDLNLIDNFLFQQVLIHEDGEEFTRILLTTILNKPIGKVKITPQKNVLGTDINERKCSWQRSRKAAGICGEGQTPKGGWNQLYEILGDGSVD